MSRLIQDIKALNGKILGRLYEDSDPQDQVLRDGQGGVLGRYTHSSNSTFNNHGAKIGYGNLLMTLIKS